LSIFAENEREEFYRALNFFASFFFQEKKRRDKRRL